MHRLGLTSVIQSEEGRLRQSQVPIVASQCAAFGSHRR
jgi:hypothetical protein